MKRIPPNVHIINNSTRDEGNEAKRKEKYVGRIIISEEKNETDPKGNEYSK